MTLKNTINGMVKPKSNEDDIDNTGMILSDSRRKNNRAAISKGRSCIENIKYNDLNIEINQRDIDRAAKKYHKEMKSKRKGQLREEENYQLQHGFQPMSAEVHFTDSQEQSPETQQEIRSRSHVRSHRELQKHKRSQMAGSAHGCGQRVQEAENLVSLEPTVRRQKQKKQHQGKSICDLDESGTLSSLLFRTREGLSKDAAHKHPGIPKKRSNNHERGMDANEEIIHGTRRLQKQSVRQHSLLASPEIPSEREESSRRQRRQKHPRPRQQGTSETPQNSTSRRRQRNHEQAQDLQDEEPWILETVPVPDPVPLPRHNPLRSPQANRLPSNRIQTNQAQVNEAHSDSPETSSRRRHQRHLAHQHGSSERRTQLHATDSQSRLRHILNQHLPQGHQEYHAELLQGRLRSPINDVVNENLPASQRRQRVQNSPRILHPCDRISFSENCSRQESPSQEDLPPSDEYYAGNEAEIPPYHATLHKYLDLISYDPRVVPCLRVNRALIKSNDKLSESIFQFLKFNLFPESIDPWEISHIDDQHYDDLIPELIPVETDSSDVLPNIPYEPHYSHHNDVRPRIISDDDYEYALYLSSLENNVHNLSMDIASTIRG